MTQDLDLGGVPCHGALSHGTPSDLGTEASNAAQILPLCHDLMPQIFLLPSLSGPLLHTLKWQHAPQHSHATPASKCWPQASPSNEGMPYYIITCCLLQTRNYMLVSRQPILHLSRSLASGQELSVSFALGSLEVYASTTGQNL